MSRRTRSESRREARDEAKRAARENPPGAGRPRGRGTHDAAVDPLWFVAGTIAIGALVAYHRTFGNPFVFDDLRSIQENATIRDLSGGIFHPPGPRAVTNRPIVNASFALNYAIGGLDVVSFHVLNLLIHLAAALLLFGIVRRTLELPSLRARFAAEGAWIAGAIALLWLVHPLAGESVTYVVQRTESLMGMFYFLALYGAIRGATGDRPAAWNMASLVALGLGLGCKEPMITAPLVVLAYDRCFLAPSFGEALRRRAPFYGAIVALVVLVAATTRISNAFRGLLFGHLGGGRAADFGGYLLTQCEAVVHYLRLSFWPSSIAGDYDDWPIKRSIGEAWPSLLAVLALLGATAWAAWHRSRLAFLGFFFFVTLGPTSLYPLRNEVVADRRMYLPLAALVAIVVLGGRALLERLLPGEESRPRRHGIAAALTLAIALGLAGRTALRSLDFASGEDFWRRVVTVRPRARRGRINLGYYTLWAGKMDESLGHFRTAIGNDPADKLAHFGLAGALQRAGRSGEAIAEYRAAIAIDPRYAKAHYNLSQLLEAKGDAKGAEWHLRVARNPRLVRRPAKPGPAPRPKPAPRSRPAPWRPPALLPAPAKGAPPPPPPWRRFVPPQVRFVPWGWRPPLDLPGA